jgi:hypothetical protein
LPLLRISSVVTDAEGNSLSVTMTAIDVSPLTDQDRRDFAASWCQLPEATPALYEVDARTVTFSVKAVGSGGFDGWSDDRGLIVLGSAFDGPIWASQWSDPSVHSMGCSGTKSKVFRPGEGTARVLASAEHWGLDSPVAGSGSITLTSYGLEAAAVTPSGEPSGTGVVSDCVIEASPELEQLALEVSTELDWGKRADFPDQCIYGRTAPPY